MTFTPQIDGSSAKPQQAMLMMVPKGEKALAAYAVARAKKDGSHSVTVSQAAIEKQLGSVVRTPGARGAAVAAAWPAAAIC